MRNISSAVSRVQCGAAALVRDASSARRGSCRHVIGMCTSGGCVRRSDGGYAATEYLNGTLADALARQVH